MVSSMVKSGTSWDMSRGPRSFSICQGMRGSLPYIIQKGAEMGRCLFVDSVSKQDAIQLLSLVSVFLDHCHGIRESSRRPPVLFC